jgi:hypothetical protein
MFENPKVQDLLATLIFQIDFMWSTEITRFTGEKSLEAILTRHVNTNVETEVI